VQDANGSMFRHAALASLASFALGVLSAGAACTHHDEPTTTGSAQDHSSDTPTDPSGGDDAGGQDIVRPFPTLSACVDTMAQMPRACDCSCGAGSDVILTCHCP
jgi:hypothetical protein